MAEPAPSYVHSAREALRSAQWQLRTAKSLWAKEWGASRGLSRGMRLRFSGHRDVPVLDVYWLDSWRIGADDIPKVRVFRVNRDGQPGEVAREIDVCGHLVMEILPDRGNDDD